jgi:hypothetical protein
VDLSAGCLGGFLGRIQPRRALLNFRSALLGVSDKRNVMSHRYFLQEDWSALADDFRTFLLDARSFELALSAV